MLKKNQCAASACLMSKSHFITLKISLSSTWRYSLECWIKKELSKDPKRTLENQQRASKMANAKISIKANKLESQNKKQAKLISHIYWWKLRWPSLAMKLNWYIDPTCFYLTPFPTSHVRLPQPLLTRKKKWLKEKKYLFVYF